MSAPRFPGGEIALLDESNFDRASLPGVAAMLNREVLVGGKLLRPSLCFLIARGLNVSSDRVSPYAAAVERVHNATLIHDDVIDEAPARRGRSTLNASGFNRRAVLAGDLLLVRALRDVGQLGEMEVMQDLHRALVDLVEGEWLQLDARGRADRDERHLREVARCKTGSLIAWCCTVPGRLARLGPEQVEALYEFGIHLGLAFQMMDDCLDFSQNTGKPFAQDLLESQLNFVSLELGRDPALSGMDRYFGVSIDAKATPWSAAQLETALVAVKAKASIEVNLAEAHLARLGSEVLEPSVRQELQRLGQALLDRRF